MPNEKVLNLPLESEEIIAIILRRVEKRLRADCFLNGAATYAGFSFSFNCSIKFRDMMLNRDTQVWDQGQQGAEVGKDSTTFTSATEDYSTADVKDSPNKVREDHDLDMPVQVQEGNRRVIQKRRIEKTSQAFGKGYGREVREVGPEEGGDDAA